MHLKGRLSINLVVLVVILLLGGEHFLPREEDVFLPFSACHWRRRFVLVRWISFSAGIRRCPFERRCALMYVIPEEARPEWVDIISFQDMILFPERISANALL